jgi:hypothetical protein
MCNENKYSKIWFTEVIPFKVGKCALKINILRYGLQELLNRLCKNIYVIFIAHIHCTLHVRKETILPTLKGNNSCKPYLRIFIFIAHVPTLKGNNSCKPYLRIFIFIAHVPTLKGNN